jgi:hypothetical protein
LQTYLALPLYAARPESNSANAPLQTTYYLYDWGDGNRLDTYFSETSQSDQRVARLSIFSVSGQLVRTDETSGTEVPIAWSSTKLGGTCKLLVSEIGQEPLAGTAYRSCLFWIDPDGYGYKLYTIWPEADAVVFANSLTRVQRDKNPRQKGPVPPTRLPGN